MIIWLKYEPICRVLQWVEKQEEINRTQVKNEKKNIIKEFSLKNTELT